MALLQPVSSAEDLLDGLNNAQREAVLATTGPVAILAGAGTGKTRVISRRAAYAIATGATTADRVLLVTFSDRAANEMAERVRVLGQPGVTARTFHAHALSQLRWFWPSRHEGAALPAILESKIPIVGRLARQLPGGYRYTPAKDLADEIEWAKSRSVGPSAYEGEVERIGRVPPIPAELFVRLYRDYERAKERANRIDFDDILTRTAELLEGDDEAREIVQSRKRWLSVDEYQDTNPLQERLLGLWMGDGRDLCVVGDEDQTIYTFTGASAGFLTGFAARHPGSRVVALTENYRSTPQVLELANRLIAATGRAKALTATRGPGPVPTIRRFSDDEREAAALVADVRRLMADGVAATEIAILVRTNAQIEPLEHAFTRASLPYQVRGQRFYERRDVKDAVRIVRDAKLEAVGRAFARAVLDRWAAELGYREDAVPTGAEARERTAALDTLLAIVDEVVARAPTAGAADFLAEIASRESAEKQHAASGVNLLTYHRAKGLEWDAVFLPMLEEGSLPIHHAADDEDALAEERRLLYVGITRARVHLALSWAERRTGNTGREGRRRSSRFLDDLLPPRGSRIVQLPDAVPQPPRRARDDESPAMSALRAWRTARARADAVAPFIVAHDSLLIALADARPTTIAELRRVKGMGPTKLERYSEEILAALRSAGSVPSV
jgi:DNA helicase-2/ATP-dependent DNA helicase PcrA